MNYYNLLNMIKNEISIDNLQAIRQDFNGHFLDELKKININNTTRKNAIKKYLASDTILQDDKYKGQAVFSNGYSILNIVNGAGYTAERKTQSISDVLLKAFKGMKPTDGEYIKESCAVARCLGWTPNNKDFFIDFEGFYFNFSLVWDVFSCIADNKNVYGGCDAFLCDMENGRKSLLLRSKYGIGYILPVVMDACHISKNANYKKYVEYEKSLDALFVKKALKTA